MAKVGNFSQINANGYFNYGLLDSIKSTSVCFAFFFEDFLYFSWISLKASKEHSN
jgi:hypothetical protein